MEEDWDNPTSPHPPFRFGDRGFGPTFNDGPTFNFGDPVSYEDSSVKVEASTRFRRRDQDARKLLAEEQVVVQMRPHLKLSTLQNWLAGGDGNFKRKYVENDPAVHCFLDVPEGREIGPHPAITTLVNNVRKYRVMSVDTEGKGEGKEKAERRIFLIVGDIMGNCILINNAMSCPNEIKDLMKDVSIYCLQSNIFEDADLLQKHCQIQVLGLVDTQVLFGSLVLKKPKGNLGTHAQATYCQFENRKFDHWGMNFNKGRFDHFPNKLSIEHASSDARQPFITLFQAVVDHCLALHVEADSDVFNVLWDALNRCTGVPIRAVSKDGNPFHREPEDNWKCSTAGDFNLDLNSKADLKQITASQKGWKRTKLTTDLRRLRPGFAEHRKIGNRLRSSAYHKKQWQKEGPTPYKAKRSRYVRRR
jgi:hypothetical protein